MKKRKFKNKVLITIGLLFINFNIVANNDSDMITVKKTEVINGYSKIDVSSGIKVNIKTGNDYDVIINCSKDIISKLNIHKSGSTLVIKYGSFEYLKNYPQTVVDITVPNLNEINLNNGAKAYLDGNFDNLFMTLYNGSHASGNGTVNSLRLKLKGGSYVGFEKFKARTVDVYTTGGANCTINVSDRLNVSASFGGHVSYYGNPSLGRMRTWFGSHIIKK